MTNQMQKQRMMIIGVLDVLSILCSYFFALFLRFDMRFSSIEPDFLIGYQKSILIWCTVSIAVFYFCRLYHSIWSQVSLAELQMICKAYMVLLPVYFVINMLLHLHMPRSYYVMGYIISFCATTAIRFSYRMVRLLAHNFNRSTGARENRIMVIGAGAAGQMLIKELQNTDKLISRV
jgi:FlaA1/EpsC-like NDP-sugar epimerase